MPQYGMLIDTVRCIGCRGCQVACKQWNNLEAEKTEFFAGPGYQNPRDLSPQTWTLITYSEEQVNGRVDWVFGKKQCMHCDDPGCVTACPVKALEKLPTGPVIYHANRCLGCRYCMMACPFEIPRFNYDSANPYISKCTMCADRLEAGGVPACVMVCPTGAVEFGEKQALIQEAKARIANNPSAYVHHIYGLEEAGGTSVFHLSNVPFDKIGYPKNVPHYPVNKNTLPAMKAISPVILGVTFLLGATYRLRNRPGLQTTTNPSDEK